MKTLDLIIKHNLWSVAKKGRLIDLDKNLENYLYNNAKFNIIDEIKNNELLEKYFNNFILNQYSYKYEKQMFAYLKNNLSSEQINKLINKHSNNSLLIFWINRNKNKSPHFEFLELLEPKILNDGTFLMYSDKSSEKIIKKSIEYTCSSKYHISEKIIQDLLLLKNIKSTLKISLLKKFKEEIKNDIFKYLFDNIKNEDEEVSKWLIKEFYKEIKEDKNKMCIALSVPYNKTMELIINDKENYDLIFEKDFLFADNLFYKVLDYKKSNMLIKNPVNETFEQFKKWNINLKKNEFNNIFFKLVDDVTIDYFMESKQNFNIEKTIISVESLLYKIIKTKNKEEISLEELTVAIEKIYKFGFKYIERGSNLLFLDYVNKQNMDYLLNHKLFEFNLEKLLHSMWTRDKELGIQLAHSIDKEIVWKYMDKLDKDKKIIFELEYFNFIFENRPKEKKIKI